MKLKNYYLLGCCLLLLRGVAEAGIMFTSEIHSISALSSVGQSSIEFDLNDDGIVDISFAATEGSINQFTVNAPSTTRFVGPIDGGPSPLEAGFRIGNLDDNPLLAFGSLSEGEAVLSFTSDPVSGGAFFGETAYLGFEFQSAESSHYGYILIRDFLGIGGAFLERAYETEAGVPIVTGAIPEPSHTGIIMSFIASVYLFRRRQNTKCSVDSSALLNEAAARHFLV